MYNMYNRSRSSQHAIVALAAVDSATIRSLHLKVPLVKGRVSTSILMCFCVNNHNHALIVGDRPDCQRKRRSFNTLVCSST
jgi:hypothetical protein